MKYKFLFTMEYVGEEHWKLRNKIADYYFETEENPFVRKNQSCGFSRSDFSFMEDAWNKR